MPTAEEFTISTRYSCLFAASISHLNLTAAPTDYLFSAKSIRKKTPKQRTQGVQGPEDVRPGCGVRHCRIACCLAVAFWQRNQRIRRCRCAGCCHRLRDARSRPRSETRSGTRRLPNTGQSRGTRSRQNRRSNHRLWLGLPCNHRLWRNRSVSKPSR